jgi:NAD(P)-dependent dehydrogenase (short-subunit alcohol dehydrogenase family)
MKVRDKHVVVTGGANGIGRELCKRFHHEGARAIVVADLEMERAAEVAASVGGLAVATDVSIEADVEQLIQLASMANGPIDLFCSNAGIFIEGGVETPDADWRRIMGVNFMAHVYAARAVLPEMIARGDGYLLTTASAAGLLSQIGSASYAVTKHAAVAFAEWIAITHGDQGIKVSCLCPQGVRTRMLLGEDGDKDSFLKEGSVSVEEVADAVIEGLDTEQFLILPHPEVLEYFRRKSGNYDRWLRGMRKLQARVQ